jgi:dihydropteroate synthase type 2
MTQILGIVNVTADSFSDGGRFLDPDAAVAHARQLAADGADWIDLGAESTHPDAQDVPADIEIERLTPVIRRLRADGLRVSVDTHKPAVMRHVLGLGAAMINDVCGFEDADSAAAVRDGDARLVVMHARGAGEGAGTGSGARAQRGAAADPRTIVAEVIEYFRARIAALAAAGIARQRLILDPGMGLFLSPDPGVSLAVLGGLSRLRELELPILVSTSRKGFIGRLLADASGAPRPVEQRGAGTLISEIWAATQGVAYVRTHDVRQLRDALRVQAAIRAVGS